jgi:hypothetical protein
MSSCANHAIQLKFLVMFFTEEQEYFPTDSDARSAFAKMIIHPKEWPAGWLSSYYSSCPESFNRDKSIGFVFVADGLSTKAAVEHSALVFFCPARSHQRSEEHCHAMLADRRLECLKSNGEMIDLLRKELRRAESGVIAYSTNAQALIKRELAQREGCARKKGASNAPRDPTRNDAAHSALRASATDG